MLTTCVLANFVFIVHECAANDSIVSFILSVLYQRFHSTCTYTLLVCTMSLYLILAGTSRQLIVDWSRSVVSARAGRLVDCVHAQYTPHCPAQLSQSCYQTKNSSNQQILKKTQKKTQSESKINQKCKIMSTVSE